MIVAAVPIDAGDYCWAFYVINDDDEPIDSVLVERVHYEWGDFGNSEDIGIRYAGIAPGACLEVHREVATEVRTGLSLILAIAGVEHRIYAEVGRLYATPRRLEPIPILAKDGMLAELG